MKRLICAIRGHVDGGRCEVLPEDGWGLYAMSRCYCGRCGAVTFEADPWAALGRYNAERSHGVVHDPEYAARMAIQQAYFNERYYDRDTPRKPTTSIAPDGYCGDCDGVGCARCKGTGLEPKP